MFAKASTSGAATVNSNDGNAGTGFKPVKGRRGTLYHLSSTVGKQQNGNATLDDVKISRRFAANRYFFSAAGILKLLIIILFLIAGTLFLTLHDCPSAPSWYKWLYPLACLFIFISTAALYALFVLGMAEDNPSFWVKLDLVVTLTEAVAIIAISIVTMTEGHCSSDIGETVLGPLGLAGAALMAVSSAATYIMWRYRSQEPTVQSSTATEEQPNPRYSVFI